MSISPVVRERHYLFVNENADRRIQRNRAWGVAVTGVETNPALSF